MEILRILETSAESLYPEDLDFFETELATGEYAEEYVKQCREKLGEVRNWLSNRSNTRNNAKASESKAKSAKQGVLVESLGDIVPAEAKTVALSSSGSQLIFQAITSMRQSDSYKSEFKEYVQKTDEIDAAFVDAHYAFFQQWEIDAIISVKQMGEAFLEKYFDVLDHDKIARCQEFSEQFFIKHFSDLAPLLVLKHGKNTWRKKPNRSKQLDVFLRLKGVKI